MKMQKNKNYQIENLRERKRKAQNLFTLETKKM